MVDAHSCESAHAAGLFMRSKISSDALEYVLWKPKEIEALAPGERLPLILFLHGRGESGTDGLKPAAQGLLRMMMFDRDRWPAVIIAPQKPAQDKLWDQYTAEVMAIVDQTMNELPIDPDRVYLTGLSQGGHGTWALGAAHPDRWAALAPICGWITDQTIPAKIASLPIWAFHGGADDVVKPTGTTDTIAAVEAAGGSPRMTIYPGVNHGSWDQTYGNPEFAKWLLAQRRAVR